MLIFQDFELRVVGLDPSSDLDLVIADYPSGCADGTTDALHNYENIHACKGRWQGHVKRGRDLCAKGWRVCSPRDTPLLKMLTWADMMEVDECYAYNAANALHRCSRYVVRYGARGWCGFFSGRQSLDPCISSQTLSMRKTRRPRAYCKLSACYRVS